MPSLRIAAAVAATLLALAGCASEPRHGRGGPGGSGGMRGGMGMGMEGKYARPVALLFVGLDADHDLRTSQAELAAALKPEWARMDKDHSGSATAFEVADWGTTVLGAADALPNRVSFDTDMSGLVTYEEFAAGLQREFDRLDANHDGYLDRAELLAQPQAMRMEPDEGGGQAPQRGGGGGRGPGGGRGRRGGGY